MNTRTLHSPLPLPQRSPPPLPALPPLHDRSPIAQRLAAALDARLRRRRGRLDRLELGLVHTVAAGAGWTTDWHLSARVADMRAGAATRLTPPAPALRSIDRGALPSGPALDALWRWVADASALHQLPLPLVDEQVVFTDAALEATPEVIRHRVLRAAAVLERLPGSFEVKLGRRRNLAASAGEPAPGPAQSATQSAIAVARLVAHFPGREGAEGGTRVVVWESARRPGLVELLRECARRLEPKAPAPAGFSAPRADRT